VVLGPIMERNYYRSLLMSGGSYSTFFETPLVLCLWVLLGLVLFGPSLHRLIKRRPAPAVMRQ
jgi:TctA family transporter